MVKKALRTEYLNILQTFTDETNLIKVITGVRRCGKSTLLLQFINQLIKSGTEESKIIRINFESSEFMYLDDYRKLNDYLYPKIGDGKGFYIFLDEIINVKEWEKSVNALHTDTKAQIYITGSNTKILSSELTTDLSGRYVSINMHPYSYREFTDAYGKNNNSFSDYLRFGGFPSIGQENNDTEYNTKLQDIYSSIMFRDVVCQHKIRNIKDLENILRILIENIGEPVSVRNIAEKTKINRETISSYIDALESSYIIRRAERKDLVNKTYMQNPKYYIVDPSLRNLVPDCDNDRILENIVYLELIRRNYKVTVGSWKSKEIDFVSEKPGKREYIQVCYSTEYEKIMEEKLASLRSINNSFPKIVLTRYVVSHITENGIRIINVEEWLKSA